MNRLPQALGAILGLALLGTACTEPVDCASEPQRCPNRLVAAAQAAPQPSKPAVPREQQRVAVPIHNGQRLLQAPLDANAPGRPPSREPLALDVRAPLKVPADLAPLPTGSPTREELKAIVATVQLPTKAKDFEGLKPFITPRLYATLAPLLAKDGERLWRHLAKYLTAGDRGFKTEVESVESGKAQLHLTLPDGDDLRPILTQENGVWKIDRF